MSATANDKTGPELRSSRLWLHLAALALASSVTAQATNIWNGTGNWDTPGNWSGNTPVDGQDVVINSGHVTLTNGTANLASYKLNSGATNSFEVWGSGLVATTVTVEGFMTHPTNTDASAADGWVPDRRVYIVCTDFTLASDGLIDVDEKGWTSPTGVSAGGYGLGGATATTCGGGHGGRGGRGSSLGYGPTYGSENCPTNPGSGGGSHVSNGPGGFGGGTVWIAAGGRATVHGTIRANGGPGLGANYRGGGSGGGVYISCGTFVSTNGLIQAKGGDVTAGSTGGGGGGGRIAIDITNRTAQSLLPDATLSTIVTGGYGATADREVGEYGTVYFGSCRLDLASTPGGGTDVPAGWYTNGAPVTITATNAPNHVFVQWSGQGVPAGSWADNPLTLTMDQSRTIQANFATNSPLTRTWSGTGNWYDCTNWNPQGVPGTGDTCIVHSGSILLSEPAAAASVSVSNATVTFSNWTTTLTATDIEVLNNGELAVASSFFDRPMYLYPPNTLPMTNRISIVCTNLFVAAGGRLDANEKGYRGQGAAVNQYCHGPGRGIGGAQQTRQASSHGGLGSYCNVLGVNLPGPTYGNVNAPETPGTGGPVAAGSTAGKAGGGTIRIQAGSVVVNGTVRADGGGGGGYVGGASGGSIFITCTTFRGTNGVITANGADHGTTGAPGGGGGRIAVVYDTSAQSALPAPRVKFSVKGGTGLSNLSDNGYSWGDAYPGTLYFPGTEFLGATVVTELDGVLHFPPAVSNWAAGSLTISNGWMYFPSNFVITVTGDATVKGTARLGLPGGALNVGGDLLVTNNADFYIDGGATNGTTDYGMLVAVTGDIVVASGARLRPYSDEFNGGSPLIRCANVRVPVGAGIDADAGGYYGNYGPGHGLNASGGGGGGYGGRGGRASALQLEGDTYGSISTPLNPGSGGGRYEAREGGGLVRVEATGTVTVDGTVTAKGGGGSVNSGCGSGGGIYIRCLRIEGAGTMTADGGDNARAGDCAGGGGRIAVWRLTDGFTHANASAAGGSAASGGTYDGEDGTVVWSNMPAAGPYTVGVLPASNITTNSARLNGKIMVPGGGPNPCIYFCWDLTDHGTTATGDWPHVDYVGTNWGAAEQTFSNDVSALLMGSNYTYRCYVTNSAGEGWSAQETFSALGWPAITNNGAVPQVRGALLQAEVTDTGAATPYTWFRYWLDGSATTTTVARGLQGGVFSASVTGLLAGSNYSYWALASNVVGTVWSDVKGFVPLAAVTNTWTGSGQNWNDTSQWDRLSVPADGEDVVINGDVVLTNTTASLASYTLNAGATITFSGWMTALSSTVVTVEGTITHPVNTDTSASGGWVPDNRVYVVCSSFSLTSNGVIDVDEKGWTSPTGVSGAGYGAGGATAMTGGGGYGGRGGNGSSGGYGSTYGEANMPANPGSGGGANAGEGPGGFGGGAVRIAASGHVAINGTITADGGEGLGANYRGGGSGGGVYITCNTFAATNGIMNAKGGEVTAGSTGGGGGGGRIAVIFTNTAAQNALPVPTLQTSVIGGNRISSREEGKHGTVYFGSYHLDLSSSPGGSTDVSAGWYTNGAQVTITPVDGANHTFRQWSGDGVPVGNWTNNPLTVTMDRTRPVQANFETNAAVTRTWSGTGNWFSHTNWSPQGIPGTGDTCVVHAGSVTLSDPATVSSLSISNAAVTFANWTTTLTATDVDVLDSGTISVAGPFYDRPMHLYPVDTLPMTNRISIVCTNLLVADGGLIDGYKKGYAGWGIVPKQGPHGPGHPPGPDGASHGGEGSHQNGRRPRPAANQPGPTYGSPEAPTAPGSGGVPHAGGGTGGSGGAAIRIQAGSVVVNGTVNADGEEGGGYKGGGSGGSIFITCTTFQGTNGVISANGGNNNDGAGAGGGGGRIAIVYNTVAQASLPVPEVEVSVTGGDGGSNDSDNGHSCADADMGSIYFPDAGFITETPALKLNGELHFPAGVTNWSGAALTLSDGWARFPSGFVMTVTGDMTVNGTARLELPSGGLTVAGDLLVTNSADFYVHGGATNGALDYGMRVDVGGDILIASGASLRPYSEKQNGGSVLFLCRNLVVPVGAEVNADSAGFYGNAGTGRGLDASGGGGGGYGGRGGRASIDQIDGETYGSTNAPVDPGSGGGRYEGAQGGGLVRVEARGTVTVDGAITAGGGGGNINSGCGAGGGIYVRCTRIKGSGMLQAQGGDNTHGDDCAGGGGRIAVWRTKDTFNHANASAAGGTAASGGTYDGEDGTVYWGDIPSGGTVLAIR